MRMVSACVSQYFADPAIPQDTVGHLIRIRFMLEMTFTMKLKSFVVADLSLHEH